MSDYDWTTVDIPDQSGRIAVITGANSGLGLETARELARRNAHVVLAVRNIEKGTAAVGDIGATAPGGSLELLELDLASLDSVRTAAAALHDRHQHIDLLINNAGVMYTPRQQTADGFEMQFGTNHLGHFAWTGLVLDRLLDTEGSRVVTVSSVAHRIRSKIDFDDLQAERRYSRVAAYGRSKLSNLLFTYELQRRLDAAGARTVALAAHPGGSDTELGRHLPGGRLLEPLARAMAQSAAMVRSPRCAPRPIPAPRAASTTGRAGSWRPVDTPSWSPPATAPTTARSDNGSGRPPRTSPA